MEKFNGISLIFEEESVQLINEIIEFGGKSTGTSMAAQLLIALKEGKTDNSGIEFAKEWCQGFLKELEKYGKN